MKHVYPILFAALLVFTALPASAQSIHAFGVKGGVTSSSDGGGFSELYKDLGGDISRRTGITLGGFVQFAPESLPFLIQPEVLYAMKGYSADGDGLISRKISMNYLDIPILARADFDGGEMMPFVEAGPVLSLLVSSTGEREGVELDISDELKSTDFALAVGGGVAFGAIDVGLRYTHGLVNVTTSDDEDESAKNRLLSVMVGYTLGGPGAMVRRNR